MVLNPVAQVTHWSGVVIQVAQLFLHYMQYPFNFKYPGSQFYKHLYDTVYVVSFVGYDYIK